MTSRAPAVVPPTVFWEALVDGVGRGSSGVRADDGLAEAASSAIEGVRDSEGCHQLPRLESFKERTASQAAAGSVNSRRAG